MGSSRNRIIRSVLFVAVAFVGGYFVATHSADAEKIAAGIKTKMPLPHTIDEDTRLDDIRATGKKELGYFMTLTRMTKAQVDANPAFGNLLETNLRGGACQNPNYQKLMKGGLTVRLTYASSDGATVREIVLAPKDCAL